MQSAPPRSGEPAPQLRLPTIDGQAFDLSAHRGQSVLVSFLRHAG
jgi:peroxiredoxin